MGRNSKLTLNLITILLSIVIIEVDGCKVLETSQDRCRSDGRIWLGAPINKNAYKGSATNTHDIPQHTRELYWWCGSSKERVAWRGGANRLQVTFVHNGGRIYWTFLKCSPPGCQTQKAPQKTSDKCRGGGHLWLADGIERSIPKGSSQSIEISRGMRELRWYCGYLSEERVAWGGNANHLRVNFQWNGDITWEFYTCNVPRECSNRNHPSSVQIQLEKLHLTSAPTDNVAFGLESVFGKPADEIAVNLESKYCYRKSQTREIKEGEILYYNAMYLNSFRDEPIKFWLTEEDSGFEGKNDLSQVVTIPTEKLSAIRKFLKHDLGASVKLNYTVKVKGKNIFQEHKWFGFLAENLCISVVDFVVGPWTGFGRKLFTNLASKKAIGRFQSKNIGKLYNTIKTDYDAKTLTKKKFFKAVMTYQIREGVKKSVGVDKGKLIREWALDQTKMDEELEKAVREAVRKGLGDDVYQVLTDVEKAVDTFSSWMEDLTGSLEFCLSEILPPAKDALYDVYFLVKK